MWRKQITTVFFWWVGLLALTASAYSFAADPLAATVRAEQESLDATSLRAIFTLRKRRWSDGRPIRVFVLEDDNPVHKRFVRKQLRMFPYQLRQYWNRVIYSGTGVAPRSFDDQQALLEALAVTPDAIGYAEVDDIPEGVSRLELTP